MEIDYDYWRMQDYQKMKRKSTNMQRKDYYEQQEEGGEDEENQDGDVEEGDQGDYLTMSSGDDQADELNEGYNEKGFSVYNGSSIDGG
ncbi:MAG: hypothetical protein EZS28_015935 [Streblomastix strix]|uniref:Uncharacterized protein n=1 Tax=Streblomastix strix TaxID=222440 RepID=A0A5J4W1K9_9EUKA|nr:MAG: hypothetical protein EZS28_015935 [Streblomastix strix]